MVDHVNYECNQHDLKPQCDTPDTGVSISSQVAEALRDVAGMFVFAIFAIGIIGMGLLAVPVLAGSVAYAVGQALQWLIG